MIDLCFMSALLILSNSPKMIKILRNTSKLQ